MDLFLTLTYPQNPVYLGYKLEIRLEITFSKTPTNKGFKRLYRENMPYETH